MLCLCKKNARNVTYQLAVLEAALGNGGSRIVCTEENVPCLLGQSPSAATLLFITTTIVLLALVQRCTSLPQGKVNVTQDRSYVAFVSYNAVVAGQPVHHTGKPLKCCLAPTALPPSGA
jgi:hypothetical protein